ncbi:uncharacterized protein METZ01_LOCUS129610, partial [marine metagenome]
MKGAHWSSTSAARTTSPMETNTSTETAFTTWSNRGSLILYRVIPLE